MIFSFNYHPEKRKKPAPSVKIITGDDSLREKAKRVLENYAKDCRYFRNSCIEAYGVPSPEFLTDPDLKDGGEARDRVELSCDKYAEKFSEDVTCSGIDAVFGALLSFMPSFESLNDIKLIQSDASVKPTDNAANADIEIKYNGDTYTNISIEKYYIAAFYCLCCAGVCFSAEKNKGGRAEFCLFPQNPYNITSNMDDLDRSYISSEITNTNSSPLPTSSYGIIEIHNERMYLGYSEIPAGFGWEYTTLVHIFWEKEEKGFSFSTLHSGKLIPKISRTDSAVTFRNTVPLSMQNLYKTGKQYDIEDIVFEKKGGKYVCAKYTDTMKPYEFVDAVINIPDFPKTLNDDTLSELFIDYANAILNALANAKELSTDTETFRKNIICNDAVELEEAPKLKKVDKFKYEFKYDNALFTVKAAVPRLPNPFSFYCESFPVPTPSFTVERLAFKNKAIGLAFDLSGEEPAVTISSGSDAPVNMPLNLFAATPEIRFKNIVPYNLVFSNDIKKVMDSFELYKKLFEAVSEYGYEAFRKAAPNVWSDRRAKISKCLFGEENMIRNDSIIDTALELMNKYEREKEIPHLAIVGQAGTGKTTLAKNLAKLFGKHLLSLTPSDIKGAYIGHTKYEVVRNLAEAAIDNKVFYLDEAYRLMDDKFGQEAVTVLLPLMTGDRTKVDASLDRGQMPSLEIDFEAGVFAEKGKSGEILNKKEFAPGVPTIWLSGYDDDIRKMINVNEGLYRRLEKVVIKPPVTSDLTKQFVALVDKLANQSPADPETTASGAAVQITAQSLKSYYAHNAKTIENFFNWGSQVQNSKFFANYAGVTRFVGKCVDAIDPNCSAAELGAKVEEIITSIKLDIKRQIAVSSGGENTGDSINVVTDIDTRFSDLVGCNIQINYMKNIVEMLVNKSVYDSFGLKIPKGALMEGEPGTGKTFIARAMAGELQERFQKLAPDKRFGFITFSGSELCSRPINYISRIFTAAEEYDACVMFIDEVDAIAKYRNENPYYGIYLELIRQMDGIEKSSNVFVLAATNAPENLDPAFTRSGRIDKRLKFELPDKKARAILAKKYIKKRVGTLENFIPEDNEKGIETIAERIAQKLSGCTAGDIESVINLAFVAYHQLCDLLSEKEKGDDNIYISKEVFAGYPFIEIGEKDINVKFNDNANEIGNTALRIFYMIVMEEIEKMRVGDINKKIKEEKFSIEKNGNNCSSVAVHEVGHALVGRLLGRNTFDSITIIPRGNSLGYVMPANQMLVTKGEYISEIKSRMGGRLAEEIVFGKDDISHGAVQDMRQATCLARNMIEQYGFSDEFGFMALSVPRGNYLGSKSEYTCSEQFREKSDVEISRLLKKLYSETLGMLSDKKELIIKLAEIVFNNETMTGEEFNKALEKELAKTTEK